MSDTPAAPDIGGMVKAIIQQRLGDETRVRVAEAARATLAAAFASGRVSGRYRRTVDGVPDAPEEAVKIPGGTIHYEFSTLAEATAFAYAYLVARSPVGIEPIPRSRTGGTRFQDSWFVSVNSYPWTRPIAEIPSGQEVEITNWQPYFRKIDVGGQITSAPPGMVEAARQAVQRRFPNLQVERRFIHIGGDYQYTLRGHAIRSGLSYNKKAKKFTRIHPPKPTPRKDARKGELMTYPALILVEEW